MKSCATNIVDGELLINNGLVPFGCSSNSNQWASMHNIKALELNTSMKYSLYSGIELQVSLVLCYVMLCPKSQVYMHHFTWFCIQVDLSRNS